MVSRRFFWRTKEKTHGKWAAYRRLAAMQRLRLVLSDKPYANQPAVLRVTREGARIADVGLRPAPLVLSQLRHSLAIVPLVERLVAENRGCELVTERELRAERYRLRREGADTSLGRTPDALLRIPKPRAKKAVTRVAIELDLARKDRRALERMVHQYDHEDGVDVVWWYVLPMRVKRTEAIVKELDAEDRFEVREWEGST